jgi:hypothetical protein
MRRAAKVDSTQAAIVSALRSAGASVWVIGLPVDLVVGVAGTTALVECKTLIGLRQPRPSRYTPLQQAFMQEWRGGPVATLTDVDGALRLVASMKGTA